MSEHPRDPDEPPRLRLLVSEAPPPPAGVMTPDFPDREGGHDKDALQPALARHVPYNGPEVTVRDAMQPLTHRARAVLEEAMLTAGSWKERIQAAKVVLENAPPTAAELGKPATVDATVVDAGRLTLEEAKEALRLRRASNRRVMETGSDDDEEDAEDAEEDQGDGGDGS